VNAGWGDTLIIIVVNNTPEPIFGDFIGVSAKFHPESY
jgi:hypothetical protein